MAAIIVPPTASALDLRVVLRLSAEVCGQEIRHARLLIPSQTVEVIANGMKRSCLCPHINRLMHSVFADTKARGQLAANARLDFQAFIFKTGK